MEEDDYRLTPTGHLSSRISVSNGYVYRGGEFDTIEEALAWVAQDMNRNRFYPDIWWISDHGNTWRIDLDGKEIEPEPEHEHEWGPVKLSRLGGNPHRECECGEITLDLEGEDSE